MHPESLPRGTIPIAEGEVLAGKYRVDRVLGVGGMGVVIAATHLQLGHKVALKFMLPEGLQQPGLVERFLREGRSAARLRSDHVARVLDVGTLASGSPYLVMEYLEGNDLGTLVEQHGPMPVDVAVDCLLQACDALAEAHVLGIVHRDLKPRNLFRTERNDGRALVKVLDFGISKDRVAGDLALTRTTEVMGSPNYMSPEQLRSTKAADQRSDIWSLGVILYELLTGRVPFVAETITQLTAMVLTEPPVPMAQLRPDLPRDLGRVVERCLEKDPLARFASVAELAAALERYGPPDTRDLVARIGRIAAAGGPEASQRLAAQMSTGNTGSSWSETGRGARASRVRTLALVAAGALVVGVGTVVASMTLLPSRAAAPAPTTETRTAAPSSAETTPQTPTAAGETPAARLEPAAPIIDSAATTVAEAGAKAPATMAPRAPRPNAGEPTPRKTETPAATPSNQATPKYRTSW